MTDDDAQVKPSEQRGGQPPGDAEIREKGDWAGGADEGLVPPKLGGSDAPREMLDDDPELGSSVLGKTTGSDRPATETGVDLEAGEHADAVADGGVIAPDAVEPDLKDAAAGPRQVDLGSSASDRA